MKLVKFMLWSMMFMTLIIPACSDDDDDLEEPHTCDAFHWEYEGEGATWGSCFMECGGQAQSPVNITQTVEDQSLSELQMNYTDVPIHLLNNGHTIQFEYETGSQLQVNGVAYELLQFHFHTVSEHTIDGVRYPMEVHLVHKNLDTDALAVIGIMFKQGTENPFLQSFMDDLPTAADEHFTSEQMVNISTILPNSRSYYLYDGSLTTPPCSEVVTWIVMQTPIEASPEQIDRMYELMQDNYRPIQPLNGREIKAFN